MSVQQEEHNDNKEALVLTCPTCGRENGPLGLESKNIDTIGWAKTAAYVDCMSFCGDNVSVNVGDVLMVSVRYPVYCEVGGVFSATIGDDDGEFITMELLNIEENDGYIALLCVRVIALGNRISFVKLVSKEEKQRLMESQTYDYSIIDFHGEYVDYGYISDNMIHLEDDFGGGDVIYEDYIYTDDDGIDHLVQKCYMDFDNKEAYFGDKVLGFHKYNTIFDHPRRLFDGSLSPEIPKGFMDLFRKWVSEKRVIPYMRDVIEKDSGVWFLESGKGPYSKLVVSNGGLMYKVDVGVFLYAMKTVVEERSGVRISSLSPETKDLYDELVRKTIQFSEKAPE